MRKKGTSSAADRIEDAVDDGSGCVETWEALSELRESPDPGRRQFLRKVGLSFGALTLGSGVGAASASGEEDDDYPEIHTAEVTGPKRGQLVSEALRSADVRYVADEMGEKPELSTVLEHSIDGATGYEVRFGSADDPGPVIEFHKSDELLEEGTKVRGWEGRGDGVSTVDGTNREVLDVATPTVLSLVEELSPLTEYGSIPAEAEVVEEATAYVHNQRDDRKGIVVPVAEGKNVVRRILVEFSDGFRDRDGPVDEYVEDVAVEGGGDGVSVQGHITCVFGVCTDWCSKLCGALKIVAGGSCGIKCARYIASWPIAVACGVICYAITKGTCYPTCRNQLGHNVG